MHNYLLIVILMTGCAVDLAQRGRKQPPPAAEYQMTKTQVGDRMIRYENKEVICYEKFDSNSVRFACVAKSQTQLLLESQKLK